MSVGVPCLIIYCHVDVDFVVVALVSVGMVVRISWVNFKNFYYPMRLG